ncbi:unnamed protein product, partial [Medioppia subpectinata]
MMIHDNNSPLNGHNTVYSSRTLLKPIIHSIQKSNYKVQSLTGVKLVNTYRCKYSYAFTKSNESLTPTTIGQLLEKRAVDSADTMACVSMQQNISKTYRQLNEDVNKLAKGLQSIGCVKRTRVGIWSPNCYEW